MMITFKNFKKVKSFFSDKRDKCLSFRKNQIQDQIVKNRERFFEKNNLELKDLVAVQQVHGKKVAIVSSKNRGKGAYKKDWLKGFDALITNEKNLVLGVETADCVPVFFYDPIKEVVAAAHMGWKSIHLNLAHEVAKIFKTEYHSMSGDINVSIGPHIQKCCFEVQSDVAKKFQKYTKDALIIKKEKQYLDLTEIIKQQLHEEGMEKISVSSDCTCCSGQYYSYRKDKEKLSGEMLNIIVQV